MLPDAPLYSNRSAVRLALGRFDDAFEDATKATETDASYAKGYYRLGQAGEKCGKFDAAQKAYEKGKELEPESKVWPSSLQQVGKSQTSLRGEAEEEGRDGSGSPRAAHGAADPGEGQGERAQERCRARVGITPRVDGVEAAQTCLAARHRRDGAAQTPSKRRRLRAPVTLRWRLDWRRRDAIDATHHQRS